MRTTPWASYYQETVHRIAANGPLMAVEFPVCYHKGSCRIVKGVRLLCRASVANGWMPHTCGSVCHTPHWFDLHTYKFIKKRNNSKAHIRARNNFWAIFSFYLIIVQCCARAYQLSFQFRKIRWRFFLRGDNVGRVFMALINLFNHVKMLSYFIMHFIFYYV